MNTTKKKNILFIEDEASLFDISTPKFSELFSSVEKVLGEQKALKLIYKNSYDIIICDLNSNLDDGITFLQQIKKMKPEQEIFTLMATENENRLGDLIEDGIHAFVLLPEQFDQALEAIAQQL